MSFQKLTEIQKKRARAYRAEQRRVVKAAKQLEVLVACFAYVAYADSALSAKEIKFTSECINSSKSFSNLKIRISASNLKAPGSSYLLKILSQSKFPPFSQRTFQRQLLINLLELCICDGALTTEEEFAVEYIATCLSFPLAIYERIKARFVSNEKAKKILENASRQEKSINSYYKILGCLPTDSIAMIKKSFRKLAAIHHPDKHASKNPNPREATKHVRNFQKLQEAYEKIISEHRN